MKLNKLLIFGIIFILFTSTAMAADVNITIFGGNKSAAQANITKYGSNATVQVQAWNTSYVKNITVNTANASGDTIHFNISNVTGYQVQEVKINGTSFNGYQAGANGMINFTLNISGNKTIVISPAVNLPPGNMSWAWIWNGNTITNRTNHSHEYALDTVYQNTGGKPKYVFVSLRTGDAAAQTKVYTGATNPPVNQILYFGDIWAAGTNYEAYFIVMPGEYYTITKQYQNTLIIFWSEYS